MPWKASSVVNERMWFVLEQESGLHSMTELCAIYNIARETGYDWLRRYWQRGLEALQDRGRAAHQHPNETPEEIAAAVLELRRAHMSRGPRKLKRVLERGEPQRPWPAGGPPFHSTQTNAVEFPGAASLRFEGVKKPSEFPSCKKRSLP